MEKISAVYKIVNTVTGDFYVGSSRNVKRRWENHKSQCTWKRNQNNKLYQDMQKYGVDKFRLQILAPVMPEYLTQVEQELIEMLKPAYNSRRANGHDVERYKDVHKEYLHSHKGKESTKKSAKKYFQSEKGKEAIRKYQNKYYNQLCEYNGRTITLKSLIGRFRYAGIPNPTQEAKKYLKK